MLWNPNRNFEKNEYGGSLRDRPRGIEFWILWLEGNVILFISPSSEGSRGLPCLAYMCTKMFNYALEPYS